MVDEWEYFHLVEGNEVLGAKGRMENDHHVGPWEFFDANARPLSRGSFSAPEQYQPSIPTGEWQYYEDGEELATVIWTDGEANPAVQARRFDLVPWADDYPDRIKTLSFSLLDVQLKRGVVAWEHIYVLQPDRDPGEPEEEVAACNYGSLPRPDAGLVIGMKELNTNKRQHWLIRESVADEANCTTDETAEREKNEAYAALSAAGLDPSRRPELILFKETPKEYDRPTYSAKKDHTWVTAGWDIHIDESTRIGTLHWQYDIIQEEIYGVRRDWYRVETGPSRDAVMVAFPAAHRSSSACTAGGSAKPEGVFIDTDASVTLFRLSESSCMRSREGFDFTRVMSSLGFPINISILDGYCTIGTDAECKNPLFEEIVAGLPGRYQRIEVGKAKSARDTTEVWHIPEMDWMAEDLSEKHLSKWVSNPKIQEWTWGGDFEVLVVVGPP
jgi:hypothetical protein